MNKLNRYTKTKLTENIETFYKECIEEYYGRLKNDKKRKANCFKVFPIRSNPSFLGYILIELKALDQEGRTMAGVQAMLSRASGEKSPVRGPGGNLYSSDLIDLYFIIIHYKKDIIFSGEPVKNLFDRINESPEIFERDYNILFEDASRCL